MDATEKVLMPGQSSRLFSADKKSFFQKQKIQDCFSLNESFSIEFQVKNTLLKNLTSLKCFFTTRNRLIFWSKKSVPPSCLETVSYQIIKFGP